MAQTDLQDLFVWVGILLALVGGLFGVAVWLRKRTLAVGSSMSSGFTLSDLRRLRKEGRMSEEEYLKARQIVLGALGGSAKGASGAGGASSGKMAAEATLSHRPAPRRPASDKPGPETSATDEPPAPPPSGNG